MGSLMRTLTRHLGGAAVCRALWAGVAALHALPWVAATRSLLEQPSVAAFAAWLGLALTITLFVLKILDVRWLRLGSRRLTALVFLMSCALVHHEAAVEVDEAAAVAVVVTMGVAIAITVLPGLHASLATSPAMGRPRWCLLLHRAEVLKPLDPLADPRAARAPPLAA